MSSWLSVVIGLLFLAVIAYLFRKGVNIGIVMLVASLVLILLRKIPLQNVLEYSFKAIVSYSTIKLLILIYLIIVLESVMRKAGMIDSMVKSLRNVVGNRRLSAALLPVVIGLLPSPGGARFSCPMVGDVIGGYSDDTNKAFVNYWFRHVWMDAFLLYPGLILASELSGIPLLTFFAAMIPIMLVSAALGWIFGLKKIDMNGSDIAVERKANLKVFFISMSPVIFIVSMYIILSRFFSYALEVTMFAVLAALFIKNRYTVKDIFALLKKSLPYKFILMIAGIMIFRQILTDSGAINDLSGFITDYGIPVKILYMAIPFLGGFSSGLMSSSVSISFPVLVSLGLAGETIYCIIAYASAFIGVMVTPLHLCAVMTAEFFKVKLGTLLSKSVAANIIILALLALLLALF